MANDDATSQQQSSEEQTLGEELTEITLAVRLNDAIAKEKDSEEQTPGDELTENTLAVRLNNAIETAAGPLVIMYGWLKQTAEVDQAGNLYWRLYTTLNFSEYYQFNASDVLFYQNLETAEHPAGGCVIGLQTQADVWHARRVEDLEQESRFLSGDVTGVFLRPGMTGGVFVNGVQVAGPGSPGCGSPPGFPGCPV